MQADPGAPRGGALILAAGFSRRFGTDKRRHQLPGGDTLLIATVRRYADVFADIAVVLREGDDDLAAELIEVCPAARIVTARDAALGMGHSLAAGIRALRSDWEWAAVALGDMPWIRVDTLKTLRQAFAARAFTGILQPRMGKRPGHPVLFGSDCFAELAGLTGDSGARSVLARQTVQHVDVDDPGIFEDLDRPV